MRTVSLLVLAAGLGLAAASPALAEDQLRDEATGNWAGPAGGGFFFRAEIDTRGTFSELRIWNGMDAVPDGKGSPELDAPGFAIASYVTAQQLEVVSDSDGSVLQVVTDFADESGEGREIVELQFLDFQFTITGYALDLELYDFSGPSTPYSCKVDTRRGEVVENGKQRSLPAMDSDALNASDWKEGAAFERGWCNAVDEG